MLALNVATDAVHLVEFALLLPKRGSKFAASALRNVGAKF